MKKILILKMLLICSVFLNGCKDSGGGSGSSGDSTPPDILPSIDFTGAEGTTGFVGYYMSITPSSISMGSSVISSCSIQNDSLPTGLSIDETTCVISGVPLGVSLLKSYNVEAIDGENTVLNGSLDLQVINPDISFGPSDNVSVFWIDQDNPNQNIPPQYQKWGQVFEAPASGVNVLKWVSFFGTSSGSTFLKLRITEWDSGTNSMVGPTLFESSNVAFPFVNNHLNELGRPPNVFSVNLNVNTGSFYIIEIIGDDVAGLSTVSGGLVDEGIFLSQDSAPWAQFGGLSFRTDIEFE